MNNALSTEQWVSIHGLNGYEISNEGKVRSLKNNSVRILKTRIHKSGYEDICIRLPHSKQKKHFFIHRLVADNFLGNQSHLEVGHLDGNRLNNKLENLKWVTHQENISHKIIHGTAPQGEKNGNSKLTTNQVCEIKQLLKQARLTQKKIASMYQISKSHIQAIFCGKRWAHVEV